MRERVRCRHYGGRMCMGIVGPRVVVDYMHVQKTDVICVPIAV